MIDPELIQVRKDEILNINSLKSYLTELFNENLNNFKIMQFGGGHANLTYLLSFNNKEYVLRRPPIGPIAPSSHDMGREHKVQKSLNALFPLAPKSIHFCENTNIIGCKFHIIERRNGYVIRKVFPSFVNVDKKYVNDLTYNSVDVLASLHLIEPNEVGLQRLGKPDGFVERQLNGWEDRWKKSTNSDQLNNVFDTLISKLRIKIPKPQHVSILHNDFKWDNIMWSFDKVSKPVAVFDYDKKRDYRFLITQNSNLLMYDSDKKLVKGFKYKSSKQNISKQPIHVRHQGKDFIVIAAGNQLKLLDRRGNIRVKVKERIEKINQLFDDGHTIKYFTARGMGRYNDDADKAREKFYGLTKMQLDIWGCKYHELILGKPSADYYIDDKGINSDDFFKT